MDQVVIGMDPHKASVTIEAGDIRDVLRATGRFGTDTGNYRQLLKVAHRWPERVWAVEGANGIGRPIAQRLLADGEPGLDVPANLAARALVFSTGSAGRCQRRSSGGALHVDGVVARPTVRSFHHGRPWIRANRHRQLECSPGFNHVSALVRSRLIGWDLRPRRSIPRS
jgi:hypothetical protein